MKTLHFDVETTGTDWNKNGIVRLAQIIEVDGKVAKEDCWNIQPFPEDEVVPEAIAVHGIGEIVDTFTTVESMVWRKLASGKVYAMQSDQMLPKDVWMMVRATWDSVINKYDSGDKFLMSGYNVQAFDIPFLRNWIGKCETNSRFNVAGSYLGHRFLDPLPMLNWLWVTGHLDRYSLKNLKLTTVCDAFEISLGDQAHDALADIRATRILTMRVQSWLSNLCLTGQAGKIPLLHVRCEEEIQDNSILNVDKSGGSQ